MDALNKAEIDNKKTIKSMEQTVFKGLKRLHPEVNIPAYDDDLSVLLLNYEKDWQEYSRQQLKGIEDENTRLRAKGLEQNHIVVSSYTFASQ